MGRLPSFEHSKNTFFLTQNETAFQFSKLNKVSQVQPFLVVLKCFYPLAFTLKKITFEVLDTK